MASLAEIKEWVMNPANSTLVGIIVTAVIAFFGGLGWLITFLTRKKDSPSLSVVIPHALEKEDFEKFREENRAIQENILANIEKSNLTAENYEAKLRESTERYNSLLDELTAYRSNDVEIVELKTKAAEALKAGDFKEAEDLLQKAGNKDLEVANKVRSLEEKVKEVADQRFLGAAASRAELGNLKALQLAYREAAEHFQAAAALLPGGQDLLRAGYLNMQGRALHSAGDYGTAQAPLEEALALRQTCLTPENPDIAISLNNLAGLYMEQGKYTEAELLFRHALRIREQTLEPEHPDVAVSLNNLAELFRVQGKETEAEPLLHRALEILEKVLGPKHPSVAISLNNLAGLFESQGKYSEAETLFRRALKIDEQTLGPEHPSTAIDLNNLAALYKTLGNYADAEPLCQNALKIDEKALGPEHPSTATDLNNLALLYKTLGNYAEAEPLYIRALRIGKKVLGLEHPHTQLLARNYTVLLREIGRESDAAALEKRYKLKEQE